MSVRAPYEAHRKHGELISIVLPLDSATFDRIPARIAWKRVVLEKKDEFHVTLLHVEKAAVAAGRVKDKIVAFFNSFAEKHPLRLEFLLDDVRYAEEEEKKTILVRCAVSNLDGLFAMFSRTFGGHLPIQPAHITLYTLQKNTGIHISSNEVMESLERVKLPELDAALLKV